MLIIRTEIVRHLNTTQPQKQDSVPNYQIAQSICRVAMGLKHCQVQDLDRPTSSFWPIQDSEPRPVPTSKPSELFSHKSLSILEATISAQTQSPLPTCVHFRRPFQLSWNEKIVCVIFVKAALWASLSLQNTFLLPLYLPMISPRFCTVFPLLGTNPRRLLGLGRWARLSVVSSSSFVLIHSSSLFSRHSISWWLLALKSDCSCSSEILPSR